MKFVSRLVGFLLTGSPPPLKLTYIGLTFLVQLRTPAELKAVSNLTYKRGKWSRNLQNQNRDTQAQVTRTTFPSALSFALARKCGGEQARKLRKHRDEGLHAELEAMRQTVATMSLQSLLDYTAT